MSIRSLAKKILANQDLPSKFSQLSEALSLIPSLPLGAKIDLPWAIPSVHFKNTIKNPPTEVKLLHSIAHIELLAIYTYWDTLTIPEAPTEFYTDLASISLQECVHFNMLTSRLKTLGFEYPCLPVNNYLYEFVLKTNSNILGRLIIASLYSEGRALDSQSRILQKLKSSNNDFISAKLMERIINDEVAHLTNGVKWFDYFCSLYKLNPVQAIVSNMKELSIVYRPPFNVKLRDLAGIPKEWYMNFDSK